MLLVEAPRPPVVSEHPQRWFGVCPLKQFDDHAEQLAGCALTPGLDRRAEVQEFGAARRGEPHEHPVVVDSGVDVDRRVCELLAPSSKDRLAREGMSVLRKDGGHADHRAGLLKLDQGR